MPKKGFLSMVLGHITCNHISCNLNPPVLSQLKSNVGKPIKLKELNSGLVVWEEIPLGSISMNKLS